MGLLGFLGTIPGLIAIAKFAAGSAQEVANHMQVGSISVARRAAEVQSATNLLCLVFVVLCVRSFIAARRARA